MVGVGWRVSMRLGGEEKSEGVWLRFRIRRKGVWRDASICDVNRYV